MQQYKIWMVTKHNLRSFSWSICSFTILKSCRYQTPSSRLVTFVKVSLPSRIFEFLHSFFPNSQIKLLNCNPHACLITSLLDRNPHIHVFKTLMRNNFRDPCTPELFGEQSMPRCTWFLLWRCKCLYCTSNFGDCHHLFYKPKIMLIYLK